MLIPPAEIKDFAEKLKEKGKRLVFTNGCFDILHAGHVRYLQKAKELGDILVLGLNSDASVKRLKGSSRPVNSESDRAEVVDALKSVDYVVIFAEDTAEDLIAKIRPHIYAKGGDYNLNNLPEAKIVQGYGGEVAFIPLVEGKSTTNIINKLSNHK